MKKTSILLIFTILAFINCLISRHASAQIQQPSLPVTSLPTAPPASGITKPSENGQAPAIISSKYAEYQSYCRQNDFDETLVWDSEQKKRRLDLLNEKIITTPNNNLIINALIKEYESQKELKKAEEFFLKQKDALSAEDVVIWTAEFESQKKIFTSASVRLEKFITDNPKSTRALIKLAQIKKKALFFSEAVEIYLDLQKLEKPVDYSVELCELYTLDSQHKDAEKICAKAIEKYTDNPIPNIYLGISYREREMFKEAQLAFNDSLKKRKTEFAYSCLGELSYLKKDRKKTIEFLNQAIELNPRSYRAHMGLALAQFEEKHYENALANFKSACKLGLSDTLEIRKAQKLLDEKKSPFARNYFEEIQKCKMQSAL